MIMITLIIIFYAHLNFLFELFASSISAIAFALDLLKLILLK